MVDTVGQMIWIYQLSNRGPLYNRLKLMAARTRKYDKLLQQYNTAEPKPEQVRLLLENLEEFPSEQSEEQEDVNKPILEESDSNSIK